MHQLHLSRLRHTLFRLLVGNYVEAGGVHAFVAVNVVDVPVGIDQRVGCIRADRGDGLADMRNGCRETGIDKDGSVLAALDRHVAARALQEPEVVVELSGLDRGRSARCAHLSDAIGWRCCWCSLCKHPSWHERSYAGRCA